MDVYKLTDLKEAVFIASALIAIPSLEEILGINPRFSPDIVFFELVKKSLKEFEQTCPLILEMKVNREQLRSDTAMPGFGEFKSNFTLYLDCLIAEDQIVLAPMSTPKWKFAGLSYIGDGSQGWQWVTEYNKPYIYLGDILNTDQFWLRGICARPIIPDWTSDKMFNEMSTRD